MNSFSNLIYRIKTEAQDNSALTNALIQEIFFELEQTSLSIDDLRPCIEDNFDLRLPTYVALAIHIAVLRSQQHTLNDERHFASFLSAYYEEYDDWVTAMNKRLVISEDKHEKR